MKNELDIRTVMSRDSLPATGTEQAVYALVRLRGAGGSGMPANLGLVLDRSGSMDGDKMERLKDAVGAVVDRLSGRDLLSVTVFDDAVETIVAGQAVQDRAGVKETVRKVVPRGGTQISDGLKAGLEDVRRNAGPDRVSRIILITDGRTWDDEHSCLALADEAGREGIAITGIGIGDDWNEKLLLQLAERSRGDSHWIEDPAAIPGLFEQELDSAQAVAATNLRVTVQLDPAVRPVKVYRTVPMIADISSRSIVNGAVQTGLGSLDGRKGQALLLELRLPSRSEGLFRIGRVEAAYDVPAAGIRGAVVARDLAVRFTADVAAASKVNAEVMNLVERVSAFKLQTRALEDAEAGDLEAATRRLQSAATVLLDLGENDLAEAATAEAARLSRTGTLTSAGTKKLEYGTRKLTQALK